jgi:hypothetical protein
MMKSYKGFAQKRASFKQFVGMTPGERPLGLSSPGAM